MQLISLNAWGGQLWPDLSVWLADTRPDILCLQEVTRRVAPGPDWLVYRDPFRVLRQRTDLFGDVCAILDTHQAVFAPAARGSLEDQDGNLVASEHGIAAFVRGDLAISEFQQAFIHGSFRPDGWGPEPVPRTLQMMRICNPDSGGRIGIAHFHGLRDPSGKGDTADRLQQSATVAARVEEFRQGDEPFVLAGDFNLQPETASFARLSRLGLRDLVTAKGHADTRTSHYPKLGRLADYMLVSSQVLVQAFDVPAIPEVSDHRPMILTTLI
ncbi:MAG: endonuclease/exonuclease/phosphatase family protein [Pseudomonadota bacterium]